MKACCVCGQGAHFLFKMLSGFQGLEEGQGGSYLSCPLEQGW